MPITCPACNKTGQTGAICSRCAADLSHLHRIATAADRELAAARAALAGGATGEALRLARSSWELRHSREAARVAFLAAASDRCHPAPAEPSVMGWWRRGRE